MARKIDKVKAVKMRLEGRSYSSIKEELGISKSTLSGWLSKYPLSQDRIRELRDKNPQRIEKYINTMKVKREEKFQRATDRIQKDINKISNRDLFVAGFFLYWAEGGKTGSGTLTFANTDPEMIKVFVRWLDLLGVSKDRLKIKLHLYKDMNIYKEIKFWSKKLAVDRSQFSKSYVKDSLFAELTYKNGFGHGTCNVILHDANMQRYILMGIRYIVRVLVGE
jgi:hypothetical protein